MSKTAPKHLDDIAKTTYKQVWAVLESLGKLHDIDANTIELYASLYSTYRIAQAELQKSGPIIFAKNGYPMQNPAASLSSTCVKEMRGILRDWGVSKIVDRVESDSASEAKWHGLA
ncbi:MAG: Phage terminase, small subunit [Planctomycetota bacterium]|nr:Phage terminase, small subunit [Planctomycetota bacterium]